jgi:hypothetical protein
MRTAVGLLTGVVALSLSFFSAGLGSSNSTSVRESNRARPLARAAVPAIRIVDGQGRPLTSLFSGPARPSPINRTMDASRVPTANAACVPRREGGPAVVEDDPTVAGSAACTPCCLCDYYYYESMPHGCNPEYGCGASWFCYSVTYESGCTPRYACGCPDDLSCGCFCC